MADVLIVCVREDEPQAKALAEMFEAAGFSIGGAPSSDAALRSSGAGVVVWSQASIRSRPFLDAAQRVINANKAIVASLIEPPPPSSIGSSPAFDLSHWDGDPNDPALDPLFFAVDRMVNSARVGAAATVPQEEYEPPAPRAAPTPPPVARARPTPPQPAPEPYRAPAPAPAPEPDPLTLETEHWRAIRDSKNPTDFMDYLSKYGPKGAFAEVAELRLKQLTAEQQPQQRAPAPTPRVEAPRREPPPRRAEAAPPPRRAEPAPPPPPPPRRAEAPPPRRMPPPDRSYDRADLRDPPRNQGGPLRALILVGLLGAAALAGGLYFGGGLNNQGAEAPQEQTIGSLDAPSDIGVEPGAVEELADVDRAAMVPTATRDDARERERERERQRQERERAQQQQQQQQQQIAAREPATPPPSTVSVPDTRTTSGGPVSLTAPSSTATPSGPTTSPGAAQTPVPLTASTTAPPSVQRPTTEPAATTPRQATPGTVSWSQRPSARRISDAYPQRALREGVGGRVVLDCVVQPSLDVNCTVASETPAGEGFGRAALSAAGAYRASPTLSNGQSAVGARTRISVAFRAPD